MDDYDYYLYQIKEVEPLYDQIKEYLLSIAEERVKNVIISIIETGRYGSFKLHTPYSNRDNPSIEATRRLMFASLLAHHPDTALFLIEKNICLFHGSNGNALPGILKYGMNSFDQSVKDGNPVITGESSTRFAGRDFISFSDVFETALDYSTISAKNGNQELSFPIIIGVSRDSIKYLRTITVISDVPEIGIRNHVPLGLIATILVPSSKVAFVSKLFSDTNVKVLPCDMKLEAHYGLPNPKYPNDNLLEKIAECDDFSFEQEDVHKLSLRNTLLRIKRILTVFNDALWRDKHVGRNN